MRAVFSSSLLALAAALPSAALGAATITIVNVNAAGVGFNDPTPAAPVGGNPGTTLGEQRLIAFQHAAGIWGAALDSAVEIRIQASFVPLTCTATTATLSKIRSMFHSFGEFSANRHYPTTRLHRASDVSQNHLDPS